MNNELTLGRRSNLVMPTHYVELDEEEMAYVDGGWNWKKFWGWTAGICTIVAGVCGAAAVIVGSGGLATGLGVTCGVATVGAGISTIAGLYAED